jgi:hypothetical protein
MTRKPPLTLLSREHDAVEAAAFLVSTAGVICSGA